MSDFAERVTRKNSNNETDLPLTISSKDGLVDQISYFNKTVASKDMSGYYLLRNGEYAYNKSYSVGYDFGSIKRLDRYPMGALSTLYICFALKKHDTDFIKVYFDSLKWYKEIYMISAEGARNHGLLNVPTDEFFATKHYLPENTAEQRKIADFLIALDRRIDAQQSLVDALKKYKRGVTRRLFSYEKGCCKADVQMVSLSELFPFIRNGFVGTVTPYFTDEEHGVRYLQGTNIHTGKITNDTVYYVTEDFSAKHSNGFEIVTHPMTLDFHENNMPWAEIMEEAKKMGYLSHQAETCGLHVHVNRTTFGDTESEQEAAIARVLYFFEKFWEELLKFSRRTQRQLDHWAARYGYKEKPKDILDHAKGHNSAGRYTAVNLTNRDTVEFRMFRGTLKYNTLIATLELLDNICEMAVYLTDKDVQGLSWTSFVVGCTQPELVQYLKERRLYVNDAVASEEDV